MKGPSAAERRLDFAMPDRLAKSAEPWMPTGNGIRGRVGRRRDVFVWATVILFFNQFFGALAEVRSSSLRAVLADLCSVGIFQYMAWYVILRLIGSSDPNAAVRWRDVIITTTLLLIGFLPPSQTIWVAATGIAIYLGISNDGDAKLRAAGVVLGGLSVQEFWGPIVFSLVALPLLRCETAVVGAILEAVRGGTVWQDNIITGPYGYGILVYRGCSSFHNVSLAVLCWLTVSKLHHQSWQARDLVTGVAVASMMILLNLGRLCLMAWNTHIYRFLHDGGGADLFAVGASVTILSMSLYGAAQVKRVE